MTASIHLISPSPPLVVDDGLQSSTSGLTIACSVARCAVFRRTEKHQEEQPLLFPRLAVTSLPQQHRLPRRIGCCPSYCVDALPLGYRLVARLVEASSSRCGTALTPGWLRPQCSVCTHIRLGGVALFRPPPPGRRRRSVLWVWFMD